MKKPVIDVINLTKIYKLYDKPTDRMKEALHPLRKTFHKDHYALKDVSFTINHGESIGIIGANGAGKSTLLKILTGVLTPTSGETIVNGNVSSLLELGSGVNPELTGYENIYFMGTIMGFSNKEIDKIVDSIVDFIDIGDYIHQAVKTYSSGMLARLGFGVAVSINPDILIIDEALSVGDIRFQLKAIRKMEELMESSKALLFVSHDIESVRRLCHRCIWLKDGGVFMDGDVKKVTQYYHSYMAYNMLPEEFEEKECVRINPNKVICDVNWIDLNRDSIGTKEAIISKIAFYDKNTKSPIMVIDGNEEYVSIYFLIESFTEIVKPYIGFCIFDSLRLPIIHLNTNIMNIPMDPIKNGEIVAYRIDFKMPALLSGSYMMDCSLKEGTLIDHISYFHSDNALSIDVKRRDMNLQQSGRVIIKDFNVEKLV